MGAGLQKSLVPIFNGKGIDTKLDPRLVPEGSLLTLENMYMLRTGELRLRNGFKRLSTLLDPSSLDNIFSVNDNLVSFIGNLAGSASPRVPNSYVQSGGAAFASWRIKQPSEVSSSNSTVPAPLASALITGINSSRVRSGSTSDDLVDPDMAIANQTILSTWNESGAATDTQRYNLKTTLDVPLDTDNLNSLIGGTRPPLAAAGGASYLVHFSIDNLGTGIQCAVFTADGTPLSGRVNIAATLVSAAQPWIDVKSIPGTNNIALAYRAAAGGVTCGIFNPATQVLGTTVNTAGADATMTLGWLDDSLATGNMYLATAGGTAGIVVRTMSATTMVVSATNVIDATTLANVRQVTGHINTGATDYAVLWDVDSATATYFRKVMIGRWTGASTVVDHAHSFDIYSRSFLASDGQYYFIGSYESATQSSYFLISTQDFGKRRFQIQVQIMAGYAGGRRTFQCSISTPTVVGGKIYVPLARKQNIVTASGTITSVRSASKAVITLSSAQLCRPRELGNTVFYPGGVLLKDDGKWITWAVCPLYSEPPTLVSSATGSMTAGGSYSYRLILRRIDNSGRYIRSAGSTPMAITLGGGDGRVTLTIPNPRTTAASCINSATPATLAYTENYTIEVYRAGPAASGATTYNKVNEVSADAFGMLGTGDTLTLIDSMSDINAALGEIAYFTGNALENFPPPASRLLEVNGNRVGIVNAEDPTEFWPSKEYKPGTGIGFHPDFRIRVTGDGYGAITALAAMDGRWILFKSQAIYVISGDGPNDLGQGSFSQPQAVSLSIGTVLPGSVVPTPDGIMFQSANGIYLLTRGLAVQYIGAPVEKYTLAENVVDASLVTGVTQVRFVMASGRCLVWDYHHQRWYTFQLRVTHSGAASTIVACANNSQIGWCYALANGDVMQETPGVYSDVNVTTTAIVPSIGFPQVNAGGIAGFQRCYGVLLEGEFVGNHTLQVSASLDLGTVTEPTRSLAITTGPYLYEVLFANQKCTTIQVNLTCALAAGSGAFRLSGASLMIGLKRNTGVPWTKRLS